MSLIKSLGLLSILCVMPAIVHSREYPRCNTADIGNVVVDSGQELVCMAVALDPDGPSISSEEELYQQATCDPATDDDFFEGRFAFRYCPIIKSDSTEPGSNPGK